MLNTVSGLLHNHTNHCTGIFFNTRDVLGC